MQLREMTKQRLRIEAMRAGWVRIGVQEQDGQPLLKWVKPGTSPRLALFTDDPDTLPMGQREAVRARLIALFSGRCPLCGAHGGTMAREEVANVDPWRLQLTPAHRSAVMTNGIGLVAEADPFVILHQLDCAAAPRWLDRAAGSANN